MYKILQQNIRPFILASTLFGSGLVGYLQYVTNNNYRDHMDRLLNEQNLKDTTRPQYEYFGINWGYRADAIVLYFVKDKLDTGDLLFMKFDCMNCITIRELIQQLFKIYIYPTQRCQMNNFFKPYPHYDSIGVVYRDQEGVYVLYNRLGEIKVSNYVECLCEPFWQHLSARKLKFRNESLSKSLQSNVASWIEQIKQKQIEIDGKQLLPQILLKLGVFDQQYQDIIDLITIEEIDESQPKFFIKNVYLGGRINIRTRINKDLEA